MDDFDAALAGLRQQLIDLDGDGVPDVAVPAQGAPIPRPETNAMAAAFQPGIADELATSPPTPQMARAGMMPTGAARGYVPSRGEDAAFALRQWGPVGNAMAPAARAFMDYGSIPAEIATGVAMQPVRAGRAVGNAMADPTLANVTDAGLQTAMALGAPRIAAVIGGAGMVEAARRDFAPDIFPSAEAQSLTRRQRREQEMRDREAAREREAEAARIRLESEARRLEADAAAKRELEAREEQLRLKQEAAKQEEWDRAVARSEEAFGREMGRVRRFSDSEGYTKQLSDKLGGLAPFVMGGLAGMAARAAGAGRLGQIGAGAGGGIAATSAPLFEDAYFTDPDNPERAAYMRRGAELPPGHPRKQEFLDYGRSLPEENPVRSLAREQIYNPVRLGLSAVEGGLAGALGGDVVQSGKRLFNAMAARGPKPSSPSGNAMTPPGYGAPHNTYTPPPPPPPRPTGGTRPDHNWNEALGRWQDIDGKMLPGKPPKRK